MTKMKNTDCSFERSVFFLRFFDWDSIFVERESFSRYFIDIMQRDEGVLVDTFNERLQAIDFIASDDDVQYFEIPSRVTAFCD